MVPCFPLLGLTPSGLFMGLSSTIIYTSELILCSTICVPSATRHNIQSSSENLCRLRSKRFRRVWEQRKTEERGFRYFACAENGARAKKRTVGVGEGKEGNACGQTPGF